MNPPSLARPRAVCAVVVNWNGWHDTLICLDSLLGMSYQPAWIVICDNGSTDASWETLAAELRGRTGADAIEQHDPQGTRTARFVIDEKGCVDRCREISLLGLPHNLGYAGAINAGMAWAEHRFAASTFWLLNNDVKAEPHALLALLAAKDAVPRAGLCGSILMDWDRPTQVQAVGGVYHRALGVATHMRHAPDRPETPGICLDVDYPVGASLLVEADYLDRVGPMDDSYFLYYEEMDWAERGRRQGFRPVVALGSRLLHKQGASTGSSGGVRHMSLLSEHYGVLNRLRITRKFWPAYLPLVWSSLWLVVLDRLVHGELRRARLVLGLMFSPRRWLHRSR